jgi:hypothetical protein
MFSVFIYLPIHHGEKMGEYDMSNKGEQLRLAEVLQEPEAHPYYTLLHRSTQGAMRREGGFKLTWRGTYE